MDGHGRESDRMDLQQSWAQLLSVAEAPQSVADREAALRTAIGLGAGVAPGSVGCSVTERVRSTYRTVTSANSLSTALDQAQYDAQAGPCVAAADEGTVLLVDTLADHPRFPAYAAAAAERGVHSSLSVPLPDPRRPAALNFYATDRDAFGSARARAVAGLLARCVATLLPGGSVVMVPATEGADLAAVRSRRTRMERALAALMDAEGLSRSAAFLLLVHRSRDENRSIHDVADDVLARADRTDRADRTVAS